jgi:hypothetical protein
MRLSWFGVVGATYDIDKSTDNGTTWSSLEDDYSPTELIDATGAITDLYRVRTHGSLIWNPAFTGTVETTVNSCLVYGWIRNSSGEPYANMDVYAYVPQSRQFLLDAFYASHEPVAITTDTSGYWALSLPVGLSVTIKIPCANITETVTIPDVLTCSLASLL